MGKRGKMKKHKFYKKMIGNLFFMICCSSMLIACKPTEPKVENKPTPTTTVTVSDKEEEDTVTVEFNVENSSIPTIYITSESGYYDLVKSEYATAKMQIVTTDKYKDTTYDGEIEIRLRGNSTANKKKRPFRIKLEEKSDLFGMGESKHWCLLANFYDRSNLRNKLSYDFGMDLGLTGCESTLVNLVFNGEYYGIYQLAEVVRIDEGRVEIFNWEDEAETVAKAIAKKEGLSKEERKELEDKLVCDLSWITSGIFEGYTISDYVDVSNYSITGGYLIENDDFYDEISKFTTKNNMKLQFKNPEYLNTNEAMMNYIMEYIQDMENAIYSPNRLNEDGKHYTDYMDIESFVDFWMVNQVFKNIELLYKSCYFYKDINGLITWGPIWDMDWTSGNHVNLKEDSGRYDTWWNRESVEREFWYRALYNDPWFILQLYERWGEIQGNIDNMMNELELWYAEIKEDAIVDNQRWDYNTWTVEMEVDALRDWLNNRRAWMSEQMKTPETLIKSFGYYLESENISIMDVYEDSDGYVFSVMVKEDNMKSADLLINGKIVRTIELQKETLIKIEDSELLKEQYNSIEVLGKDDEGNYIILNERSSHNGSSVIESDYIYVIGK